MYYNESLDAFVSTDKQNPSNRYLNKVVKRGRKNMLKDIE